MDTKRETWLEKGFSEEQTTMILNMFHNTNKQNEELQKTVGDLQAQLVGYGDTKAKLDALEREKMTADEKLKADQEQASKNLRESEEVLNRAKVKVKLAEIGEIDDTIINLLAKSDDPEKEADTYVERIKARDAETQKKAIENFQKRDVKPNGSNAQNADSEETVIATKEQFDKLLMENYTKAKQWKDSNPDLYANLK